MTKRIRICRYCGKDPYPNMFFCNNGCHRAITECSGNIEEESIYGGGWEYYLLSEQPFLPGQERPTNKTIRYYQEDRK